MTDTTPSAIPKAVVQSASNTLLVGATGTGKTHCLRTLVEAGITPFVLSTEPGIASTLGDVPSDKLHWQYLSPSTQTWDTMLDNARKINNMSFEALAKLPNVNKNQYGEFLQVITACGNFTCDRTGEEFGDVSTWGPDRAIVVDSLSGLNLMAMNAVVGAKPTKSMADWGVAMDLLERLLIKLTTDTRAMFVLTAHMEREQDEITGGVNITASTLGRKLAPRIPRFFDDVIHCKRDGSNFLWSTATHNMDLKARNLPYSESIPPSFVPLIEAWRTKQQAA